MLRRRLAGGRGAGFGNISTEATPLVQWYSRYSWADCTICAAVPRGAPPTPDFIFNLIRQWKHARRGARRNLSCNFFGRLGDLEDARTRAAISARCLDQPEKTPVFRIS